MASLGLRRWLAIGFAILLISQAPGVGLAADVSGLISRVMEVDADQWREASPTRVMITSNSDWARILFDDLNGTNTNGIRIKSVVNYGWLAGRDADDQVYAGHKIAWPDTEFDQIITRKGDMVAFFKGLGDFHDTEVYADLVLEVNVDLPQVYVWLMTGGKGTTEFVIASQDTGGMIWRDIVVASGETQQVRRVMSPQPFFRAGRTESTIVVTWLTIAILVMIVLNFPIIEALTQRVRGKEIEREPERGRKDRRDRRPSQKDVG